MPTPTRVLVVDDDAATRLAYSEVLGAEGYDVLTAESRAAALAQLERAGGEVDLLVLDIGLPDADGSDVAREIAMRIGPRPTVYISGWADEFLPLDGAPGRWIVLQKPIPAPRLLDALRRLTEAT